MENEGRPPPVSGRAVGPGERLVMKVRLLEARVDALEGWILGQMDPIQREKYAMVLEELAVTLGLVSP